MKLPLSILATGILALSAPAMAQTTYFGENLTPNQAVSGAPVTARNNFLAQLAGVSTESFESFAQGSQPTTLTFTGSAGTIAASFSPSSGIICASNGCNGSGRFATAGTHYFDVSSAFSTSFSTPPSASTAPTSATWAAS